MSGVDPQEFGRLESEVAALRRDSDRQTAMLEKLQKQLTSIEVKLSEARGGWKALMLIGGASATFGGTVMAVAQKLFKVLG